MSFFFGLGLGFVLGLIFTHYAWPRLRRAASKLLGGDYK